MKSHFSTALHNAPGTSVPLDYYIIVLSPSDCNGSAAACTVFTWSSHFEDFPSDTTSQKPFAAELITAFLCPVCCILYFFCQTLLKEMVRYLWSSGEYIGLQIKLK